MRWDKFEQYVENIMSEEPIVGLGVAVAKHGQELFCRGFGVADLETRAPVDKDTIFGTASITKSFTALAVMRLVEQGQLSLDVPVSTYLPKFKLPGVRDITTIKLRHLLTHSTGLPPMRRRQELTTFDEHLDFLGNETVPLLGAPGEYVSYCNDTFLLLGAIIEAVTGTGFRQHITQVILEPLQMQRSTLNDNMLGTLGNLSTPYMYHGDSKRHSAETWPKLNNYVVGGGVRSCLSDLMKYGEAYIGLRYIASPLATRAMYSQGLSVLKNTSYGFGLRYTPAHGEVTVVEHGGGQVGVSSHFGFAPEAGLVVAVLANVTNVSAARIWLAALNTALDLPLEFSTTEELPHHFAGHLSAYVGTYTSAEGGKVTVMESGDKLAVETEGMRHELTYAGGSTFFFRYRGQRVLRFFLNSTGEAWSVLFGLRMLRREAGCSAKL